MSKSTYVVSIEVKGKWKQFEVPKEVYDYIITLEVQLDKHNVYKKLTTSVEFKGE